MAAGAVKPQRSARSAALPAEARANQIAATLRVHELREASDRLIRCRAMRRMA